jgi:hypothetical protein
LSAKAIGEGLKSLDLKNLTCMIDLRFGFLFPWHFRLIALLAVIGALGILQSYPFWSLILFLVSALVLSAAEGTEVNTTNNTFREYTSYFFIKTGKFNSIPAVDKLFITRGTETQVMHTAHTNHSSSFENVVHNGYLKFSSGEKIQLLRDKKKERLIQKLVPLSEGLKVDIIDHS